MSTPQTIEPGAILCATWGYDQTNATFFRVEKRAGQWATLRELETVNHWHGGFLMSGTATPGAPTDKTRRRKVRAYFASAAGAECVKAETWGMYASPWDGEPVPVSCYA